MIKASEYEAGGIYESAIKIKEYRPVVRHMSMTIVFANRARARIILDPIISKQSTGDEVEPLTFKFRRSMGASL
ncbi:MAG: hypothetical protein WAU45_14870 [Blastocatellia bacterium]